MNEYDKGKFYQMPKEAALLYGLLPGFDSDCKIIYAILRDKRNGEGCAWPSRYALAMETGISSATLDRKIKKLVEYGLVTKDERADGGGLLYYVCDPLPHDVFIQRFPEAKEAYDNRATKLKELRERDKRNQRKHREKIKQRAEHGTNPSSSF